MNLPRIVSILIVLHAGLFCSAATPVPESINYQGRLVDGTNLVNRSVQIVFRMYDTKAAGTTQYAETQTVAVVDGLYATAIGASNAVPDALAAASTNAELWLELDIDGVTLSPRERIGSVLYAIKAGSLPAGAVTTAMLADGAVETGKLGFGAVTGAHLADGSVSDVDLAPDAVTGTRILDGSVTAADLAPNLFWTTDGNAGTVDGVHHLGTADLQPLNLVADGRRALRIEPDPVDDAPNLVGGSAANGVAAGVVGAVIAGGGRAIQSNRVTGSWGVIGGGELNLAVNDYDAIGGGFQNTARGGFATVSGGSENQALGGSLGGATVGGGLDNQAQGSESTVGGGWQNAALADFAAISGGRGNRIETNAEAGTIAGGQGNTIASNVLYASISGGVGNQAGAFACTVAGGTNNLVGAGAEAASIGGGDGNEIRTSAKFATIAGGTGNTIEDWFSAIGGGWSNSTGTNADFAVISGGWSNQIWADSEYTAVAGGRGNRIQTNASYAAVGGGGSNRVEANAEAGTIAGGQGNTIASNSLSAVVGGGSFNYVGGQGSTISGGFDNNIEYSTAYSMIGGGSSNWIMASSDRATIGGGELNTIETNAHHATIGGGEGNVIKTNSSHATVGGGRANLVHPRSYSATIGGGDSNRILTNAYATTIGGGTGNYIGSFSSSATISGGWNNHIATDADWATISGGAGNLIQANARFASIPGGAFNSVAGGYGLASGYRAEANHAGTFVWADTTETNFTSTADKQFLVRAGGGVGINTNQPAKALHVAGDIQVGGTVVWGTTADDAIINFGDPNFVYIGEMDGDDTMELRAQRFFFRNGTVGIGRTATVHRLEVQGSAGKTDGLGNWTVISDRKSKTDIAGIGEALDTIERLRPVRFRYNDDYRERYGGVGQEPRYGFIAQEYEEVFPDDVTTDPDTGYRQLNASAVSPHLVAALQELNGLVQQLQADNEGLRQRIMVLEDRQPSWRKEIRK